MTYGEAIHICQHLADYSENEIILAVEKILSMETINAVPKHTLRNIVQWFFDNCVEEAHP